MVFDRKDCKKSAKVQLKGRWSLPVLMTLICGAILFVLSVPELLNRGFEASAKMNDVAYKAPVGFMILVLVCSLIGWFLNHIMNFAQTHVYLKMHSSSEKLESKDFFDGMSPWKRSLGAGLWQDLWTSLWSLLFMVPGAIKHYSYYFTRYIVTEYKDVSIRNAMKISMKVTKGYKWHLFVTELSFIGWILLGFCSLGIGYLWIDPYFSMTMTNIYKSCMAEALESGKITEEDLKK